MIFYLVPAAAGRPAMLQPTQADANREARERGLKVRAPDMEHEVPTVKAELMAYINGLMLETAHLENDIAIEVGAEPRLSPQLYADSAPPIAPVASVALDATPTPAVTRWRQPEANLSRDQVCLSIAEMAGHDLGFVALEVACRFETLGKEVQS